MLGCIGLDTIVLGYIGLRFKSVELDDIVLVLNRIEV